MTTARYVFGHNPDLVEALWCVDNETGEQCLINLRTNEIIAKRIGGRIVDPSEGEKNADR